MCGCGCELGLVLATCRAGEVHRPAMKKAEVDAVPRPHSVFERLVLTWLTCMFGEMPMQGPMMPSHGRRSEW